MADNSLVISRPSAHVALLTLNNPDQRNAMSHPMTEAWVQAVAELKTDPELRAVVVTGAGRAFCSGGDTSWIASEPDASVDALRTRMVAFYRAWLSIRELEVPTIAAINGAAIGAGLCMPLACDLRVAAPAAKLGMPFVKLGMHPGMAGSYLLPNVVGPAMARDLLLTGRIVTAEEALAMGLVTRILDEDGFVEGALEIAEQIAATAPIASKLTKIALARGHADLESCLEWEALAQPITLATEDLQEGINATSQRRTPRFTGT